MQPSGSFEKGLYQFDSCPSSAILKSQKAGVCERITTKHHQDFTLEMCLELNTYQNILVLSVGFDREMNPVVSAIQKNVQRFWPVDNGELS